MPEIQTVIDEIKMRSFELVAWTSLVRGERFELRNFSRGLASGALCDGGPAQYQQKCALLTRRKRDTYRTVLRKWKGGGYSTPHRCEDRISSHEIE